MTEDALIALARKALGQSAALDIRDEGERMWLASAYVVDRDTAHKPEVSVWANTRQEAVRGLRGALRAMARGLAADTTTT